jgi:hypothetical protein
MQALNSKYFINFNYLAQGIKVHQGVYPIVKMAWVEGDPLGIWLDKNVDNSKLVENARAGFATLASFLQQHGIAHGDIQNGNVMIAPTGITLIDYDGMYVPGMPLGNGSETGHKHFQHPSREALHFGPSMDRFSFIAVDLSLRALIEDPTLYGRFREGGETIIFRANDFVAPQNSEIFQILRRHASLKLFTENFAKVCQADIRSVPTLEDFLAGRNIPAVDKPTTSRTTTSEGSVLQPSIARYIGPYPVLSTDDYAGVMQRVGQRIELVGCIQALKHGVGRRGRGRGKPYVFVNFGNWRGNIVKLTIWSEGLAQLRELPDDSWIGRWVSVVGLVDAPYSGKHYSFHYTHVGITIETPQQINVITEREAKFRIGQGTVSGTPNLAGVGGRPTTPSAADHVQQTNYRAAAGRTDVINPRRGNGSSLNRSIIDGIMGPSTSTPPAALSPQARPEGTTNQDILRSIRQAPITPPIQPQVSPAPARRAGGTSPPPVATPPSILRRLLRFIGLNR